MLCLPSGAQPATVHQWHEDRGEIHYVPLSCCPVLQCSFSKFLTDYSSKCAAWSTAVTYMALMYSLESNDLFLIWLAVPWLLLYHWKILIICVWFLLCWVQCSTQSLTVHHDSWRKDIMKEGRLIITSFLWLNASCLQSHSSYHSCAFQVSVSILAAYLDKVTQDEHWCYTVAKYAHVSASQKLLYSPYWKHAVNHQIKPTK